MSKIFLETIKAYDGKIFHLKYHQKRYEQVLKSFGVEQVLNLQEYLNPPQYGLYRCRLTYDISKSTQDIKVSYTEYKKRDTNSLKVLFNNEIEYTHKSTCRDEIDAMFGLKDEADDILIIKDLLVCDTSIANIAFYKDGVWLTPKTPLLKGTTRARLLDEGKIIESNIRVQELRTFSKIALLNAMIEFDILEECNFLI